MNGCVTFVNLSLGYFTKVIVKLNAILINIPSVHVSKRNRHRKMHTSGYLFKVLAADKIKLWYFRTETSIVKS